MTNHLAQDLGGVVLLPCPFCGAQPELHLFTDKDEDPCAAVECGQCYGSGPKHVAIMDDARPAAIAAWNRRTHSAEIAGALRDAERMDYIERTFSGMTNRERYLPVQMIWGKGANGRTLREACDKYMQRESAMQQGGGGE